MQCIPAVYVTAQQPHSNSASLGQWPRKHEAHYRSMVLTLGTSVTTLLRKREFSELTACAIWFHWC
jgi:hypothetical protein